MSLFVTAKKGSTLTDIVVPWMPSFSLIKSIIACERLYRVFKDIKDDREKTGRREDDALQELMDIGDSTKFTLEVSYPFPENVPQTAGITLVSP